MKEFRFLPNNKKNSSDENFEQDEKHQFNDRNNNFNNLELKKIPTIFRDTDEYKNIMGSILKNVQTKEIKSKESLTIKNCPLIFTYSSLIKIKEKKIRIWRTVIPLPSDFEDISDQNNNLRINLNDSVTISWDNKYNLESNLSMGFNSCPGKVKKKTNDSILIVFKMAENEYFPDSKLSPFVESFPDFKVPYYISFKPDLIFIKRSIEVIENFSLNDKLKDIIFGKEKNFTKIPENKISTNLTTFELNTSQFEAVNNAFKYPLSLIQGPPGCGKTHTIASIVEIALLSKKYQKILVCGPSNVSIENIVSILSPVTKNLGKELIWSASHQMDFDPKDISILSPSEKCLSLYKIIDCCPQFWELFVKSSKTELKDSEFEEMFNLRYITEKKVLKKSHVICTTLISSGKSLINQIKFDLVIIDEATQAFEPESLIPISKASKNIVLVGDQNQLGPNLINDQQLSDIGYGRSLFERLVEIYGKSPIFSLLDTQYRMHPDIADFPNSYFYNGDINNGIKPIKRKGVINPVSFIHADGTEEKMGLSYLNQIEANVVLQNYLMLQNKGIRDEQIGIIAPYAAQIRYLRTILEPYCRPRSLKVASVDSFQGHEKNYIIVSLTRTSLRGTAFFNDKRRINVTLTRAKYGLIVIGNIKSLESMHSIWKDYAFYCNEKKFIQVNSPQPLPEIPNKLNDFNPFRESKLSLDKIEFKNSITFNNLFIIWPDQTKNLQLLTKWRTQLFNRINNNKEIKINLALKTEHFCIKIGEIFTDIINLFSYQNENPEKIINDSFLIFLCDQNSNYSFKLISKELSLILNHPQITIYTFNLVNDTYLLNEIGVSLKLENFFDACSYLLSKNSNKYFYESNINRLEDIIKKIPFSENPIIKRAKKFVYSPKKQYPWNYNLFFEKNLKIKIASYASDPFFFTFSQ